MRIRFMVLGALALLCAMAFYPSTQVAAKASYYYSFGQGLKPFSMGTDSPASLTTFERGTNSNGCFDNSNADGYANLKVSTRKSNALTWIGMDLPTMGNTTVRYSVSVKDTDNCAACVPVGAISAVPLTSSNAAALFKPLAPDAHDPPMPDGWNLYWFNGQAKTAGELYIAVGFKAPSGPGMSDTSRNEAFYDASASGAIKVTSLAPRPFAGSTGFDCIDLAAFPTP